MKDLLLVGVFEWNSDARSISDMADFGEFSRSTINTDQQSA
jgi:hypothetical protein